MVPFWHHGKYLEFEYISGNQRAGSINRTIKENIREKGRY